MMKSVALASSNAQKREIEQFKKRRAEHM
jgi:hypothetical protein